MMLSRATSFVNPDKDSKGNSQDEFTCKIKKKLGNKSFSKNVYFVYNTKFIQDGNKMSLLNKIQ